MMARRRLVSSLYGFAYYEDNHMTYTTSGMVDGKCGHRHTDLREAVLCLFKYRASHPYSDRTVKHGDGSLLNVAETIKVGALEKEQRERNRSR